MINNLGTAIKIVRNNKNITQEFVYRDYCSRRQFSRIENNLSLPSLELMYHISIKLDISIDLIIEIANGLSKKEVS